MLRKYGIESKVVFRVRRTVELVHYLEKRNQEKWFSIKEF